MTRKDYVLLSDALRQAYTSALSFDCAEGIKQATKAIAHALRNSNPNGFDFDRFVTDVIHHRSKEP